ncbi:MAG: threonine synthase [Solirubrobacteraceae bacterium]|nr:threonine synthase [Solirubrobacteraceae bacterium]MEA2183231.1 threonine synthase [Solirubrobacteraceae bacterium]MEA2187248.1 threonine synthase [Solirubrobacteraceae bacterium]MEA2234215.1 threonine synthase [Solirubrobacteraceae bacterium]
MAATRLKCRECATEYPLEARYVCSQCFGPLEVGYEHERYTDVGALRRRIQGGPQNIWRYHDFLPLEGPQPRTRTGLPAGCTPLIRADRLAERLGLGEVWVKNDAANPTHSFKDRVVSVAATRARELGFDTLACASTGNLANSVAAHGAALGMASYVLIPADLEEQKILATGVYGTNLVKVRGNYDDVNRLCTELSGDRENWAFVNINMRPYYAEGSKTLAFEIAEQLGWELPDRCVVPIASGSLFTKIAKGFGEFIDIGLIDGELPTMNGAQATGCSPVATAFAAGHDFCRPVKPRTIAKSLAIGNPADGPYALDLARATGGSIDAVSDQQIRDGIRLLAETTGVFTETAGGVTTAVLQQLAERGDIGPDERVVLVITGEGLKTLDAVRNSFEDYEVDPTIESFEEAFAESVHV